MPALRTRIVKRIVRQEGSRAAALLRRRQGKGDALQPAQAERATLPPDPRRTLRRSLPRDPLQLPLAPLEAHLSSSPVDPRRLRGRARVPAQPERQALIGHSPSLGFRPSPESGYAGSADRRSTSALLLRGEDDPGPDPRLRRRGAEGERTHPVPPLHAHPRRSAPVLARG